MIHERQVTIVIPVFNEAENLPSLLEEIRRIVSGAIVIIVVDDASEDGSAAVVHQLIRSPDPALKLVQHRYRCGQSAAICSGVRAANTPWIATLDGDGQNTPADLFRLLEPLASTPSLAMVSGLRLHRCDGWSKRWGSRVANWIRQTILKDSCSDSGCGIKLFRRDYFLQLPYFTSMHRFLPALFHSYGHVVQLVAVSHRQRRYGRSKYRNLPRALAGLIDLMGVWWLLRRTRLPEIIAD